MRRAVSSFTVEVRRRPRLAITSNPHVQSSETKSPQAGFDESLIVSRPRLSRRGRWIRPLLMWRSAARGRKTSEPRPRRSRCGEHSETPHQPRQSLTSFEGAKRRDQASKSPRNRDSPPPRMRRWLTGLSPKSRQPSNVQSDEGAGVSPRVETTEQSKSFENPEVWRWAQRQDEETSWRSLATTSGSGVCLAIFAAAQATAAL